MASAKLQINVSGLARRLVQDDLLNEKQADQLYQEALRKRIPFVTHLVESKVLNSGDIAVAASQEFGVPLFDLNCVDMETLPIRLVDEKLIRNHHALPLFKRGNRLFLALSDPANLHGLDEIKFHTGLTTEAVVVEESKLASTI